MIETNPELYQSAFLISDGIHIHPPILNPKNIHVKPPIFKLYFINIFNTHQNKSEIKYC